MKIELDQFLMANIQDVIKHYKEASSKEEIQCVLCDGMSILEKIDNIIKNDKIEFDNYVEELANSIY